MNLIFHLDFDDKIFKVQVKDRKFIVIPTYRSKPARSWWIGANAVRVKCLSMYSNIISSSPHHACDVTLGTIFSRLAGRGCEGDGTSAGATASSAAGNSRGPRKASCKYYNKRKRGDCCSAVCRGGRDRCRPILDLRVAMTHTRYITTESNRKLKRNDPPDYKFWFYSVNSLS